MSSIHYKPDEIEITNLKNRQPGFGLTLVFGLPFSQAILAPIQEIRCQVEQAAPGCFIWYADSHLHATLMPLIRTKKRTSPPLRRSELPANLQRLAEDLSIHFASLEPFQVSFQSCQLQANGIVKFLAELPEPERIWMSLRDRLAGYSVSSNTLELAGFDPPKREIRKFETSLGYLDSARLGQAERCRCDLETALLKIPHTSPVCLDTITLAHYRTRTLEELVGRIDFPLGVRLELDETSLLRQLGIE